MTDPETADATYIEPITWQSSRRSSQGAPDAILPTMGADRAQLRARPARTAC
jgi:carbamoyl-phosphate synthase large subunit